MQPLEIIWERLRAIARDAVVAAVKSALDEAGIEIPFPYRTPTFKHPLEIGGHSLDRTSREAARAEEAEEGR